MVRLKDAIHHCDDCKLYPCTEQPVVESDICKQCPTTCCKAPLLPLMPCEAELKNPLSSEYCPYFNVSTRECIIYDKRPIGCRIASCGFIRRGKIPKYFRIT